MRVWEYRVETIDDNGDLLLSLLNRLGEAGWELVGFRGLALIFKRLRQ